MKRENKIINHLKQGLLALAFMEYCLMYLSHNSWRIACRAINRAHATLRFVELLTGIALFDCVYLTITIKAASFNDINRVLLALMILRNSFLVFRQLSCWLGLNLT